MSIIIIIIIIIIINSERDSQLYAALKFCLRLAPQ